jgi:hypothetical protein
VLRLPRHVFVRLSEAVNGNKNRMENRFGCPQKRSDPEGGIPSGSLEVLGGRKLGNQQALVSLSSEITQTSASAALMSGVGTRRCSSEVFPVDVMNYFNCFAAGNHCEKPESGPSQSDIN